MRSLALALFAVLLSGCQATLLRGIGVLSGAAPAEVRAVPIADADGLALDRYEPDAAPRACVVFFYGGSWRNGERGWYRFVGRALADRGYRVVIPDYRKAPRHGFPSFMEDAALAVADARARHCRDADRALPLFLLGHSAGAHIAVLLATDARHLARVGLRPQQLAGVVGLAGPYNFLPMTDPDVIAVFRGDPMLHDSQPIHFVDGDEPALLLLHGGRDSVVKPHNSLSLAAAVQSQGGAAEVRIDPEAGHIGLLLALRRGSRPSVFDPLDAFFTQRINGSPISTGD
ncbi:MAG: alpha/beta hydrolase [Xanthomonadales bacterium]|jgi:acetyl esterase/lipase|nr:alpha/beta hydrolase [Xanthomonadales bacterium]